MVEQALSGVHSRSGHPGWPIELWVVPEIHPRLGVLFLALVWNVLMVEAQFVEWVPALCVQMHLFGCLVGVDPVVKVLVVERLIASRNRSLWNVIKLCCE